ncbi:MAG: stage III sporulation protein AA [Syntrophomonadaceae bacterium]|nr:stage III sporulation protein AA [Syntrophomonadaceae bacterium]
MAASDEGIIKKDILPFLSLHIKQMLLSMSSEYFKGLEEIRLRCGQPLALRIGDRDYGLDEYGRMQEELSRGYLVNSDDIYRSIAAISDNSLYAFEEEISRGFITIPGGHRVGLAGQVVLGSSGIQTIKDFSGIAFRIAREVKGCSQAVMAYIYPQDLAPVNTLFISAPRCGKTTILRDVARHLSQGTKRGRGCNVTVIDERSELAGTYQGRAQMDLGPRTDVLDSCPKAKGMIMAIRSLAPHVLITDEIGRQEDIEAIRACVNAGVAVVTSVHARNLDEVQKRPVLRELLTTHTFETLIVLSRRYGPGTIEQVVRWDELCCG